MFAGLVVSAKEWQELEFTCIAHLHLESVSPQIEFVLIGRCKYASADLVMMVEITTHMVEEPSCLVGDQARFWPSILNARQVEASHCVLEFNLSPRHAHTEGADAELLV